MDAPISSTSLPFLAGAALAILFLLICSAIFSGSETALTTANRGKLHKRAERGDRGAQRALRLTDDKERLIGAILLGNNLVNIMAASLATMIFTIVLGEGGVAVATLLMTALVLIFSEVLPKTYAITNADTVARRASGFMTLIVRIAAPVVTVVQLLVRGILRLFGVQAADAHPFAAHEEIAGAISLHHFEGTVETADRDRLLGALDLAQRSIEEVMTHRRDVEMIDIDRPPTEIITAALASGYSRIPLWRRSPEDIVGILHTRDLARAMHAAVQAGGASALETLDIAAIAMKPSFVPEVTGLDDQLHAFMKNKTHLAIVIDEYGAMRGLVTLEDILEEIVGDITDEHDTPVEAAVKAAPDGSVAVRGGMSIREVNRAMGWDLPEEDAVTMAGLVIDFARRIPDQGETFEIHGHAIEVLERDQTRLTQLRVRKLREG
ncbi:HlyC/CorC family transporter [Pararhodobacter sp. SW119]|uniref:HlyC/CorC family transporter n=1 Tax=Pararhodobacter sp. SW119 TaxID=2780075 RepID=UPI001ADFE134|nr:HlyC/CorC family transporter [Pararhodobacter sp. SW119]